MSSKIVAPERARPGKTLAVWTPEDKAYWASQGQAIAKLNLWLSVPALFLAFAIWQLWSVVAVNLPLMGFKYSTNQLFWLASAPALSGATLRIFYSFMVPLVGGRRWTAICAAAAKGTTENGQASQDDHHLRRDRFHPHARHVSPPAFHARPDRRAGDCRRRSGRGRPAGSP